MRFGVRPARRADLPAIPAIEAACEVQFVGAGVVLAGAGTDWRVVGEGYVAACAEGRLLVAVDDDDAPVGFVLLERVDGQGHVGELDVLPALQGLGIGSKLLEAACARAAAQGCSAVTLTTFRTVPWNAPFYRRRGFEEVAAPGPELRRVLADEVARGLRADERCAMVRWLG